MAGSELARRPRTALQNLIESREDDFKSILPRHATVDSFMGLAVAYVRRDETLKTAARLNPQALIVTLRECAALGHMPMKGTYALVAFKTKAMATEDNPQGWTINGIEEVRGTIQRMYRAGGVRAVHVQLVREKDLFRWNPGRMALPDHDYDVLVDPIERGPLVAVYAWADMREGGTSQVIVLNRAEVMRYRAVAKTGKFWDGPWEPEMWQKTALHRLEKFVPTSAEFLWNMMAAESGAARTGADLPDRPAVDPGYDDVVDAEVVPDGSPGPVTWPETAEPGSGVPSGGADDAGR